jgi:SAM-dependent methyltransferase
MKETTINQMSSQTLRHLYPVSVCDWFSRTVPSQLNFQAVQQIIKAHPPSKVRREDCPATILDWGCGNLLWSLGLFPQGVITGVEMSENNLQYARLNSEFNNPNQKFTGILYNKDIKIPENLFDYSLCFGLIELIDDADFNFIFRTIYNSLKPGGKLIVTLHNWRQFSAVYLPWIFRGGYAGYTKRLGLKIQKKTLSKVASDFTRLGYDVVDSGAFNPYPSKVWKFIFSNNFYTTRNRLLSSWYYTQFLVLSKHVD